MSPWAIRDFLSAVMFKSVFFCPYCGSFRPYYHLSAPRFPGCSLKAPSIHRSKAAFFFLSGDRTAKITYFHLRNCYFSLQNLKFSFRAFGANNFAIRDKYSRTLRATELAKCPLYKSGMQNEMLASKPVPGGGVASGDGLSSTLILDLCVHLNLL